MNRQSIFIRLIVALGLSVTIVASLVLWLSTLGPVIDVVLIFICTSVLFAPYAYHQLNNTLLSQFDSAIGRLSRQVEQLNSTSLVSETDLKGAITYVNQLFCDVAQFSREELLGKNHNMISSGFHDSEFWQDYWDTIQSGNVWRGEICNRAKDGSIYWVYAIVSPIYDENSQEVVGFSSVRVNITEVKLAKQKEAARQERIIRYNETLASLIRHPMFIKQRYDELLMEVTKVISNTLGVQRVSIWTLENKDGQDFIKLVNLWNVKDQSFLNNFELYQNDFPSYFAALFQDRVLIYDDVYDEPEVAEFTTEYFPSNNITSMLDAPFYQAGKLAGVICLEHVDTPRKWSLEEQSFVISLADILTIIYESKRLAEVEGTLKHTEKLEALGKLTGGIAHDFNNMLGVIMGYSDLLVNSLEESSPLHKYAKQIQGASQRGAKLTKNLLSFSRKKQRHEEEVNLADFLTGQQELIEKTLTVAINIQYQIPGELWSVWIDRSDMEHALLNLCINAMHAMENQEDNFLKISLSQQHLEQNEVLPLDIEAGDYVVMEFVDNGSGIPEDVIDKIFDPFFTTKGDEGTGIGLAQVFSFMQHCNGTIQVNSTPGEGTTFSLYFPRHYKQASLDLDDTREKEQLKTIRGKENILIVDDEEALCKLTSEILDSHGYQTHAITSAIEALDYLENNSVDLVISDIVMPRMDGYMFTSKILEKKPEMKVQLMSGYSDSKDNALVSEELSRNIIRKPFQPQFLLEKVRRLLDA